MVPSLGIFLVISPWNKGCCIQVRLNNDNKYIIRCIGLRIATKSCKGNTETYANNAVVDTLYFQSPPEFQARRVTLPSSEHWYQPHGKHWVATSQLPTTRRRNVEEACTLIAAIMQTSLPSMAFLESHKIDPAEYPIFVTIVSIFSLPF